MLSFSRCFCVHVKDVQKATYNILRQEASVRSCWLGPDGAGRSLSVPLRKLRFCFLIAVFTKRGLDDMGRDLSAVRNFASLKATLRTFVSKKEWGFPDFWLEAVNK